MDPPEDIVEGAIARHVTMVREFGGTPGVNRERWLAALTPKHCALSLVGEPIMYPHINALLRLLHARGISSFLVTNAQFPDAIAALEPVTQLYVSIDAGNEADLREVDRPLFSDFWARFLGCLDALRAMAQAYADRSLTAFERVVEEFKGEVTGDGFITRHVAHLTDKLLEQNLLRLIEPFSCVELSHLSDLIGLPALRVEAKLGQLILDKRLHATLDQGRGQLVVFDGEGADAVYASALKAVKNLGGVVDALQKRADTEKL